MEQTDMIPKKILDYSRNHSTPESDVLYQLKRATWLKVLRPVMMSGHIQGGLLQLIGFMLRPKYVLELGTYTGYGTICLAENIAEGGKVITIDNNEELIFVQKEFMAKSGMSHRIDLRQGNAMDIIPELDFSFDLIYIDADKKNYAKYYDLILPKLSNRGMILADNVLWYGKVCEETNDATTIALQEFNKKVNDDDRVVNLLLPLRDGLMMIRKC